MTINARTIHAPSLRPTSSSLAPKRNKLLSLIVLFSLFLSSLLFLNHYYRSNITLADNMIVSPITVVDELRQMKRQKVIKKNLVLRQYISTKEQGLITQLQGLREHNITRNFTSSQKLGMTHISYDNDSEKMNTTTSIKEKVALWEYQYQQ